VRVLLAFILVVTIGAMWETRRDRLPRALPLIALSAFVAIVFFSVYRLV
jgi:hypothetical protein